MKLEIPPLGSGPFVDLQPASVSTSQKHTEGAPGPSPLGTGESSRLVSFDYDCVAKPRPPTSSLPHPFHSLTVKRVGFTETRPVSGHEFTHAASPQRGRNTLAPVVRLGDAAPLEEKHRTRRSRDESSRPQSPVSGDSARARSPQADIWDSYYDPRRGQAVNRDYSSSP